MTTSRYLLHGLCIESPVALGPAAAPGAPADLELSVGPQRPVPMDLPRGEVLVSLSAGDRPVHTGVGLADGFLLRVHGLCDFAVAPGLRSVSCRPDPAAAPEQIALLVRGPVLAFVLGLAGECCLHASAVQMPASGDVVGFVARSGGGKSTLAALACAAGARFVVDDLLRLDPRRAGGWIGTSAELRLRLRPDSPLERLDPRWEPRLTVDGRTAVTPPGTALRSGSLASLAILALSRTVETVHLQPLAPAEAVIALSGYPRLAVWKSPRALEAQFDALSELAAVTPVFVATVPWRAPVDPVLGAAVLDALRGASSIGASVGS